MRITFSNNPIDRFSCWFENSVVEPFSRYYYSKKKSHYQCAICGRIEAPYFTGEHWASVTKDMGWYKFKDSKRWVCHHCADHGFVLSQDCDGYHGFSWDAWQELVKEDNEKILNIIKEKDPEYYHYWFEGGREQELFGEDDDDDE